MNKVLLGIFSLYIGVTAHAEPTQSYLEKFLTYTQWCQHLPTAPDPVFLAFIETPTPLTKKLREKWLYQLAYNKDWVHYTQFYRGSEDTNLQCYAQTALYNQGMHTEALQGAKTLWLNGGSQPIACNNLFIALLKNNEIDENLIKQRIILALENHNLTLVRYLLKQLKPARTQDADLLTSIYQNPKRIAQLEPGPFHGEFYLYGLQLIAPRNMDEAIKLSQTAQAKKIMTIAQEQRFLAFIALYKAMRNEPDAGTWFAKVMPAFYNEPLLEWEIRYALIHHNWAKVKSLINQSKAKNEPGYTYWMARAQQALGEKEEADKLYLKVAGIRNYYGFLASLKLNKKPNFENEQAVFNEQTLAPYKLITDRIKDLYRSHQTLQASRLLNDFVSELPKNEKSALAYWVGHHLHWYGKSVYLSNTDDLNNQLALRFPLAHQVAVRESAKNYQIPKELIYAVIRQESSFHDDIISPAGANGLMQVMPGTAMAVAKRANINYADKRELFSPQKNISIGTAYLQQLAKQYHQHPILMMAAYNAGPRQVNHWLKNHAPKEIDIWIETLPWRETRNYLKNIVAFYAVYQYRMQEKPNLDPFMQAF